MATAIRGAIVGRLLIPLKHPGVKIMEAYDYDRQEWVRDPVRARALLLKQKRRSLELLTGADGDAAWRIMRGRDCDTSRAQAIRVLQNQVCDLLDAEPASV